MSYENLQLIWWILIGVLLIGFTLTDGFDMGVGMLLPWLGDDASRRAAINSIGPHWEGNQVWLVLAGGAIFAAWPRVYASVFSGLYFPMMVVLFALFFRPVGFDYRSKLENESWRKSWDWGIFTGSLIPALIIGVAFGNLLQGFDFSFDQFMRVKSNIGFFSLLNPLGLMSGLVAVFMFAASGGYWIAMRTNGQVSNKGALLARWSSGGTLFAFIACGIILYITNIGFQSVDGKVIENSWYQVYQTTPLKMSIPLLTLGLFVIAVVASRARKSILAFVSQSLGNLGILLTFAVTYFPFVVVSTNPGASIIYTNASSSEHTLFIMTVVSIIFVPLILGYTVWSYVKMWRKLDAKFVNQHAHSLY